MNYIDGIVISNYRSFGSDIQKIGPFSKLNIFIGKNNSGKSNILKYLTNYFPHLVKNYNLIFNKAPLRFRYKHENDIHLGLTKSNISLGAGFCFRNEEKVNHYFKVLESKKISAFSSNIIKLIFHHLLENDIEMLWLTHSVQEEDSSDKDLDNVISILNQKLSNQQINQLLSELCPRSGGSVNNQLKDIIFKIVLDNIQKSDISIISALRQINNTEEFNLLEFDGGGLILELAKFQDPEFNEWENKEKYLKIQGFLREITNSPKAKINIPFSRDYIQVDIEGNGNYMPLESLGTGIHEVLILAAACTILHDQIICIEEPELHLHPLLQRKLINYINAQTNNQYFISTHSAHFLDTPEVSIFHVQYENGSTIVHPAYKTSEKSFICDDLGYKPSDLFQSNCIIWVEGPSDRIYLNHWIHEKNPYLIEGIHYSIMFYGGKLLSHLTAEDPEDIEHHKIEEFISLRKINRKISIIMDSDKKAASDKILSSKEKIKVEFDKGTGHAWVTQGREIENYLPEKPYIEAVKIVHPRSNIQSLIDKEPYECRVKINQSNSNNDYYINKVRVAKEFVNQKGNIDFSILDLEQQVDELIQFISSSNK